MTLRPAAAWRALRAADPPWWAPLVRHVLPLSILPALAWPVGQALSGELAWSASALGGSFVATVAFVLASILVLALGLFVLAPAFTSGRQWSRSVAVAAYAATPVLVSGVLLVLPVLLIAVLVCCLHGCALCYGGVQAMLGCRQSEAAFFVAAAAMFGVVASLVVGGLCSAAGLI